MNPFIQIIFNPATISLLVDIFVGLLRYIRLPSLFVDIISVYLIFTIGFKGGTCLGISGQCSLLFLLLSLLGILLGFIQPFVHYIILKYTTNLDKETASVISSEYGSISIITFITAVAFLHERAISYDTFMPAIAGLMEIPAIFSGLWMIKRGYAGTHFSFFDISKTILSCKKISVIFIGFFIGLFFGMYYMDSIPIVLCPFTAMLILFMFIVGMNIAQQRSSIFLFSPPLIAFALYMPFINGCLGLFLGSYLINNLGTLVLFAVLVSSASYIAVPAVMSTQAKNAKEAVYLSLSLGITLPFNILIGIPFYYYIASLIQAI